VKFCINPDAHAMEEIDNVTFGVNVARKGGLLPNDVVNTKSLAMMKSFLRQVHS
jgi:DNA polymerase (family 10)